MCIEYESNPNNSSIYNTFTYITFVVTADDAVCCYDQIMLANRMNTLISLTAMHQKYRQFAPFYTVSDFTFPLIDKRCRANDECPT